MQLLVELTYWIGMLAAIIYVIGGIYLLNIWNKQSTRLMTDLPLVFGVFFFATSVNLFMLATMSIGIIPDTLDVFRIRALVIGASTFMLLAIILHIWLSRFRKYFKHILLLLIAYWAIVTLLAPTEALIMILVMPVMLIAIIGVILTFSVTYRTGRLKEVRSGLIVIAMVFGLISQLTKVTLIEMGYAFLADILTIMTAFLLVIAIANPWKPSAPKVAPEVD